MGSRTRGSMLRRYLSFLSMGTVFCFCAAQAQGREGHTLLVTAPFTLTALERPECWKIPLIPRHLELEGCPHQAVLGFSHPECQWGWLWCWEWILSSLNISLPAARALSLLKDNFSSVTYAQKLFTLGFSSSICWRISLCFSTSFSCLLLWASSSCQKRAENLC